MSDVSRRIDAAVIEIDQEDDVLVVKLLGYAEAPIDETLRKRIHACSAPKQPHRRGVRSQRSAGRSLRQRGSAMVRQVGVHVDLVASHGQTVWHQVAPATPARRCSWRAIGDSRAPASPPLRISARATWPRAVRRAAGIVGRRAAFCDQQLVARWQNIGGIGNVTWVPPGGVGGDCLPSIPVPATC